MKKVILLLLTMGMCISSCSKDDDTSKDSDKIIGTWGNYKEVDFEYGYDWEIDPYNIENQVQFLENGTLKSFIESETSYIEGTWENMNNGTYKMVYFGITEIIDIDFMGEDEMVYRYPDVEYYWVKIR
ncbi:hypothetical protein [Aestuariivivens marinum]|uniref:hypothetical protein n=1 Tax=Aestuariivivens marinum TaxID=2913555 RepID=UPI001F58D354|nr:hypothetical protein [Aestuariivivens marinum]